MPAAPAAGIYPQKTLKYLSAGTGSNGMLVLPGSLGGCEAILRLMTQAAPSRRILMPEYPPAKKLEEYLEGIEEIVQREYVKNLVVYGASFGGLIAQCWVRRHPELVSQMILSGSGFPDPKRAMKNRKFLKIVPWIPMALTRSLLKILVKRMLRNVRDSKIWAADYGTLISELRRIDLESRYHIAIDFDENYRFTESDLSGWPGQILILEGSNDRIATRKIREALWRLYPQARTYTFVGAGHSAMLSHTEEWLKVLATFIAAEPD